MAVAADRIDDVIIDPSSGISTAGNLSALIEDMSTARVILLRTLVAEATTATPEMANKAGLLDAYRLLADLQNSHQGEVAAAFSHPHTGIWLGRVLRRIRAITDDGTVPLWADCGYLGWLAAAVGIRCRPEGSMKLVVRNGAVMLPGIGMALLGASDLFGHCVLHWSGDGSLYFTGENTVVRVPSVQHEFAPEWLPLRRVWGEGQTFEVVLDDLDPFRELSAARREAPRLSTAQVEQWQADFSASWELLHHDFDRYLAPIRECLKMLVPLSAEPLVASMSHTAYDGVGCVYTTAPADPCQLALTLIHEIQHTKFTLLTDHVLLLTEPNPPFRCYAPWRDDPRPIFGLLHGIYAFAGVTDFWRVHRHAKCHGSIRSHVDFELGRMQLETAMAQVVASGLLTTEGEHFFNALAAIVRSWADENIPAEVRLAVSEATIAHRTFWQVRNRRPSADGIAELAARWASGRPIPRRLPPATWTDQDHIPDRYCRLRLSAQLKSLDSADLEELSSPDQPEGDRLYLAGDVSAACAQYARELRQDPCRPQLWAGLALALPILFPDNDFGILTTRAEIAAHLYQAVDRDTDVVDLVRWLSNPRASDE
ncbi:HEXXH motif domain-containing protein [Nocardia sp. CY41]|uniref:HEXXH motif domain-containing protein n=1 Tax=Nocardia sp. CY41 TaxID=2608686 RepID=UPI001357D72B|nr:HEXXH motif domain-containing protein [Nocardia sp. CY41]